MPVIGDTLPTRNATASSGSANATTKVQLEDDTHEGTIVGIILFHEDKRDENTGEVVKGDPSVLNTVRVKVQVESATLSRKMTYSTYENSNFAKFLAAATGIPVKNEPALRQVNTDDLIGKPIRVLTCYNPQTGYTNIDKFLAPKKAAAAPAPASVQNADEADNLADEYARQQAVA